MVLVDLHGIPHTPCYSGQLEKTKKIFYYWTITIFGTGFSCFILINSFSDIIIPQHQLNWFRLLSLRSPLLREYTYLFSFPLTTKMFQFIRLSLSRLWIHREVLKVALFRESLIHSLFPAPQSFSLVSTPFIVSEYLGVHPKQFYWLYDLFHNWSYS